MIIDSCHMSDRCNPNPCEHGGVCKQNSKEFYCECEDTGILSDNLMFMISLYILLEENLSVLLAHCLQMK